MGKSAIVKTAVSCIGIGMVIFMVAGLAGCAGSKYRKNPFSSRTSSVKKASARYHDFGDVLIPAEMKRDDKNCFIYQTAGFAAGVLSIKGRVEVNSLVSFFETNMLRDNWKSVSSFKSPKTLLLFQKENRYCVISVTGGDFSTKVEIWVAPTTAQTGGLIEEGLMKQEL